MIEFKNARFLRKPSNLSEVLYAYRWNTNAPFYAQLSNPARVYIAEERTLSKAEWDTFTSSFLQDCDFINAFSDNSFGIYEGAWPVLRVRCDAVDYCLLIDPQGYGYARYVAIEEQLSNRPAEAEHTTSKHTNPFGSGTIKYHTEKDFPATLKYGGCRWYRSSKYTFIRTGMTTYRYETEEREEDLRLYVDAAGHIWDEKTDGIL